MTVKQIYDVVNSAAKNSLGGEAMTVNDTSGFVSLGQKILSSADYTEQFYKSLIDRIGKTVIAIRTFDGYKSPIRRDYMDFGVMLQKISYDFPEAVENPVWTFTQQKNPYDVETLTKINQYIYASVGAFSFEDKIPTKQLKHAFTSAEKMAEFINGIYINWENAYTVALTNLDKLAVNTAMAAILHSNVTTCKRNLLEEYNSAIGDTLTVAKALNNADFLSFCAYEIGVVIDSMATPSRIFNLQKQARQTKKEYLVVEMLSRFTKSVDRYLMSSTFHNELVSLPNYINVDSWQGKGATNSFDAVSKINVTYTPQADTSERPETVTVEQSGIIAFVHDIETVATTVYDESVEVIPSRLSKVTVYQHEASLGYLYDQRENGVVFYLAE